MLARPTLIGREDLYNSNLSKKYCDMTQAVHINNDVDKSHRNP